MSRTYLELFVERWRCPGQIPRSKNFIFTVNKTKCPFVNFRISDIKKFCYRSSKPIAHTECISRCKKQRTNSPFKCSPIESFERIKKKFTRSEVRTHAGIPPLELKSNALTTRPSWLAVKERKILYIPFKYIPFPK